MYVCMYVPHMYMYAYVHTYYIESRAVSETIKLCCWRNYRTNYQDYLKSHLILISFIRGVKIKVRFSKAIKQLNLNYLDSLCAVD